MIVIPESAQRLSGIAEEERLLLDGPGSPARLRELPAGMTGACRL
jgi:hypothetical protein